jgi:hypothetical protein
VKRIRRGKTIEIPDEWIGHTTHPQTIRKRRSKLTPQQRSVQSHRSKSGDYFTKEFLRFKRLCYVDESLADLI